MVVVVAAWMLDSLACTGMELGPPRVSTAALADLYDLLMRCGQRRSVDRRRYSLARPLQVGALTIEIIHMHS